MRWLINSKRFDCERYIFPVGKMFIYMDIGALTQKNNE